MTPKRIGDLLDRIGCLEHLSDLDLLLFFYRHPQAFLSSERLAVYVGYDLLQAKRSLETEALPAHGQARAGAGAPQHRDDDVPRDGHAVLAGSGGGGDEREQCVTTLRTRDAKSWVDLPRTCAILTPVDLCADLQLAIKPRSRVGKADE